MSASSRSIPAFASQVETRSDRPKSAVLERIRAATRRYPGSAVAASALLLVLVIALAGPFILPLPDPAVQSLRSRLQGPFTRDSSGQMHIAGTDQLGRDVLSRTIEGARLSLGIAMATIVFSGVIGSAIGLLAGYRRGAIDFLTMRWVDLQMAVPPLLLAMFLLYIVGASVRNLIVLLVVFAWVGYARIVRAETFRLKAAPFVDAAIVSGSDSKRILFKHILPQLVPVLVVIAIVEFAAVILAEAGLSFLGFGVQPPDSSWGRQVSDGQAFVTTGAWWLFAVPGGAIFITVLFARLSVNWLQACLGGDPTVRR